MTLSIDSPRIYTKLGVPISVTGVAQVKVESENQKMLHDACQQLLGKNTEQIKHLATETLEGHQRSIMGTMTVEEIYMDRKKFSKAVVEEAKKDLLHMGMSIVSYTIRDVTDEHGYLLALGMSRTAEVKRDARIGQSEAQRDAAIREARANQAKVAAQYENKIQVAQAERDYKLKTASYTMEIQTKKAEADLATDLQRAKTMQKIRNEQMRVMVVERAKQIQVQEQEIIRRERELESEVKKPAKAEKFRQETLAEAEKNRIVLEAQAKAQAIQAQGDAEAYAIHAKAQAEADAMQKKADAWHEYQGAAMVEMVLSALPKVAAEIAAPLSQCGKVTMVAGANGDVGASRLTGEVLDIMTRLPEVVKNIAGVDISKAMSLTASQSSV